MLTIGLSFIRVSWCKIFQILNDIQGVAVVSVWELKFGFMAIYQSAALNHLHSQSKAGGEFLERNVFLFRFDFTLLLLGFRQWTYSVTQLPVEFQWHWRLSSAEISIIRTLNMYILMILMIKMINLMDVIPYITLMTDISALDNLQCHWNFTSNWVTE